MSRSHVNRILKEADLKPHKTEYWCGKSKDPEFEEKMTNIVGLYMNPPENAIIICVDEKTQMQALDRKYRNKKLHIIADNLSVHKHEDVKECLSHKRKITLHFTPTYSSWLNQVEIWFNILTTDVIKGEGFGRLQSSWLIN